MTATNELWAALDATEPRLQEGFTRMRAAREAALARGEKHAGWKVAYNTPAARQRFGITSSLVGYLLESGRLPADRPLSLAGSTRPGAEIELVFQLGADLSPDADQRTAEAAIGTVAAAIEIVDIVPDLADNVTEAMGRDIWQRAYLIGAPRPWSDALLDEVSVRVSHNGEQGEPFGPRAAVQDAGALLRFVAGAVTAVGETLRAGDIVLSGMFSPALLWLKPGDRLTADYGPLGGFDVTFV
jgi:2-keto-4-pentenoate hydratase